MSGRTIPLVLMLTALAAAATVSLSFAFIVSVHPFAEARWGFHVPARFCGELVADARMRAWIAGGLTLTAIMVHVALAAVAWRRSARKVDELTSVLDAVPHVRPSPRLIPLLEKTGTGPYTTIVDSDEVFAFTAGNHEPRIYLSRAAVASLDDDELEAVLLHENHHRLARDPFRMQILLAMKSALGYLPATRRLVRAYLHEAEYAADDDALRDVERGALLRAFVKLAEPTAAPVAVAGYTDFAVARVKRLTSGAESVTADWPRLLLSFTTSLAIVAAAPFLSFAVTELHPLSNFLP